MKYMVDIDGTICITTNSDYSNSIPIMSRIEYLNRLYNEGHEIHYWTARGMSSGKDHEDLTIEQLAKWNAEYTSISIRLECFPVI